MLFLVRFVYSSYVTFTIASNIIVRKYHDNTATGWFCGLHGAKSPGLFFSPSPSLSESEPKQ